MESSLLIALLSGSSLAVASSAHCVVMCGPLALTARVRGGARSVLPYLGGRLVSYTVAGSIAGSIGNALLLTPWARWMEAGLSWLLAAALLFAGISALRSGRAVSPLVSIGKGPRASFLGRALARLADDPLLLGAATALLPCGALFSALAAAAALGSAREGALAMAAFATLSGLAMAGAAQLGSLRARGPVFTRAIGAVLVVGALVMLARPIPMLRAGDRVPACHQVHTRAGANAPEAL